MSTYRQWQFSRQESKRRTAGIKLAVIVGSQHLDAVPVDSDADTFTYDDQTYVMDPGSGSPYADGAIYFKGRPNPIRLLSPHQLDEMTADSFQTDVATDGGEVDTVTGTITNPELLGHCWALDQFIDDETIPKMQNDIPDPRESTWADAIPEDAWTYMILIGGLIFGIIAVMYIYGSMF